MGTINNVCYETLIKWQFYFECRHQFSDDEPTTFQALIDGHSCFVNVSRNSVNAEIIHRDIMMGHVSIMESI